MQDFLVQHAEIQDFIRNSQMSKESKRTLSRMLMEESRRIEKDMKLRHFLYENGKIDFYKAYKEAHEFVINSNVSNDAKELLLLPLKKQLFVQSYS